MVGGLIGDLPDLRYFVDVARCGSFSQAVSRTGVSIATLSKAVKRLEQKLGIALLERTTRSMRLTRGGHILLEHASRCFDTIDGMIDTLRAPDAPLAGTVRLSTVTEFGKTELLRLLPDFFESHPLINLVVSFHDLQKGLSRDGYDIRITWGERLADGKVARVLRSLDLIMIASPDYLRRRGMPAFPADIAAHDCITVVVNNGVHPHWHFQPKGRPDSPVISIKPSERLLVMDELGVVADAAQQGLGLAVCDRAIVAPRLADGQLVQVFDGYHITGVTETTHVVLQYRRRKQLSAPVQAFLNFLLSRYPNIGVAELGHGQ